MPVVTVDGPGKATKEQKKEIIEKVSQIVADAYDMPVESITVLYGEHTRIMWEPEENNYLKKSMGETYGSNNR